MKTSDQDLHCFWFSLKIHCDNWNNATGCKRNWMCHINLFIRTRANASLRRWLDIMPSGLLFKQLLLDPAMLMHDKTCMIIHMHHFWNHIDPYIFECMYKKSATVKICCDFLSCCNVSSVSLSIIVPIPASLSLNDLCQCMRFPTMWYVRPAKPQISLRICTVWSEPLLVAWVFYYCEATDWTPFGIFKHKRRLQRLIWVCTCQNATLLEVSCTAHLWVSKIASCVSSTFPWKTLNSLIIPLSFSTFSASSSFCWLIRTQGYKHFSCSTQLSMKFQLHIKTKMLKNKVLFSFQTTLLLYLSCL